MISDDSLDLCSVKTFAEMSRSAARSMSSASFCRLKACKSRPILWS